MKFTDPINQIYLLFRKLNTYSVMNLQTHKTCYNQGLLPGLTSTNSDDSRASVTNQSSLASCFLLMNKLKSLSLEVEAS
jgi:hypothetical protein